MLVGDIGIGGINKKIKCETLIINGIMVLEALKVAEKLLKD